MKTSRGLNAAHLRILAMALMLLDHLWATIVPGSDWMTHLGRMAFPIFAFQAAEGYRYTHDFKAYCKRLLIFGLVSEIPFNLMISGSPIFPFHQNVMFTLLLGLLACRMLEQRRPWLFLAVMLLSVISLPDYGPLGVLTVLMFHVFRGRHLLLLLGLFLINWFGFGGQVIMLADFEIPVQAFAVFAWIPIRLYSGEKGPGGRALQYAAYLFYPAHMLILVLIARFG